MTSSFGKGIPKKPTCIVICLILALKKRLGSSSKYTTTTKEKKKALESYWCNKGNCCEVKGLCYSQRNGKCDLPSQDSRIWTTSPICRDSCGIPVPLKLYIAGKLKVENNIFQYSSQHSETEIHMWLLRFGYWDQYTRLDKQSYNSIKRLHFSALNNLFSRENRKVVKGPVLKAKNKEKNPPENSASMGTPAIDQHCSAQDFGVLFRCRPLINCHSAGELFIYWAKDLSL